MKMLHMTREKKGKFHPEHIRNVMRRRYYVDFSSDYRDSLVLAGTGRSGTTWISEVINYRNEYRLMDEPDRNGRIEAFAHFNAIALLVNARRGSLGTTSTRKREWQEILTGGLQERQVGTTKGLDDGQAKTTQCRRRRIAHQRRAAGTSVPQARRTSGRGEEVSRPIHPRFRTRIVARRVFLTRGLELVQEFLLTFRQVNRRFDDHVTHQVAMGVTAHAFDALAT